MGTVIYENDQKSFEVKRFWGGDDRGVCYQFTMGTDYIQITNKELRKMLKNLIDGLVVE